MFSQALNERGGTVSRGGGGGLGVGWQWWWWGVIPGSLKSIKEVTATGEELQSGHVAHS